MVRLKGMGKTLLKVSTQYFNSKMVRLKVDWRHCGCRNREFQFQDGAVKSRYPYDGERTYSQFQFQDGAVKRKKLNGAFPLVTRFQFQDGAVKRFHFLFLFDTDSQFQF